jgi:inosine-uridine nucleoside N-ribohydrolase
MMGADMPSPIRPSPALLDVDPGIDDSLAILLALRSPELEVVAITVVAGNVDVEQGLENALKVVELAGARSLPVAKGAASPLVGKLTTARHVHGENGLGDIHLPNPSLEPYEGTALELLATKVEEHSGDLTLVPVGPLTNIAALLTDNSELVPKIKEIVLMGGSFSGGNVTPAAEFNIYNDPEAAEIVFQSAVPKRMVTLDVTRSTVLRAEHLIGVESAVHPIHKFVLDLSAHHERTWGGRGIFLHDPLAVGIVADPSLVVTKPAYVEVETSGEKTRGATIANTRGFRLIRDEGPTEIRVAGKQPIEPNAQITVGVDADRFVRFFLERILRGR